MGSCEIGNKVKKNLRVGASGRRDLARRASPCAARENSRIIVPRTYHKRMRWIIVGILSIAGLHALGQDISGRQLGIGPIGRTNRFIASPSLLDRNLFDRTNRIPAFPESRIVSLSNRADRSFSPGRSSAVLPAIRTNSSLRTAVAGAPVGSSSRRFMSGTPGVQGTSTLEPALPPPPAANGNPGSGSPPP